MIDVYLVVGPEDNGIPTGMTAIHASIGSYAEAWAKENSYMVVNE